MTTTPVSTYYSGSTYTWSLTALDSYVTYTVTTTNGTATLSGSTLSYTPATAGAGGFTINGRGIALTISTLSNWIAQGSISSSSITASRVKTDSSSNIYSFGNSGGAALSKISSTAVVGFTKQLGTSNANFYGGAVSSGGNIAGVGYSGPFGSYLALVSVYNSSGTLSLQKSGNQPIFLYDAIYDGTDLIVCGFINSAPSNKVYIAKLDSSLAITWQKTLDFTTQSIGYGIAKDSASNYYVAGDQDSQSRTLLAKYNSSGVLQWQKRLTPIPSVGGSASFRAIAIDSSNNIYCGGYYGNNLDQIIAKYDTSGNIIWVRGLVAGAFYFSVVGIDVDSSGNVYPISTVNTSTRGGLITKYNSSGVIQFQRIIRETSGIQWDSPRLATSSNGKIIVGGYGVPSSNYIEQYLVAPNDGTLTGTYTVGSFTYSYSASTFTDADQSGNLTAANSTGTDSSGTMTLSTSSFSDTSLTQTLTYTGL
jgi:hypothetical protein